MANSCEAPLPTFYAAPQVPRDLWPPICTARESERGSAIHAESDSGERTGLLCMQRVSSGGPQGDIVGVGETAFYA